MAVKATDKTYIANQHSESVTVIDGANNTSTVPVGAFSHAMAVNPATNKTYIVNYSSDTVTLIDGATNATTTTPPYGTPLVWPSIR